MIYAKPVLRDNAYYNIIVLLAYMEAKKGNFV